jgi:hypothetical protein
MILFCQSELQLTADIDLQLAWPLFFIVIAVEICCDGIHLKQNSI